ncbi:hypothetical protein H310_02571 [Aphanomyces invadans]|uniref:alpha-1,2-Mannosidase n=1 Tax=Aphanomyces invadans TaxID=157072 RepID=A0A024UIK1_9STRA|nr:hypothetical protein H310_02571 [Aphanomyces invadans]ETW06276.1 hypothetical protein H310_02571 [Aphanomyces invadans]|eukprot:XP_008864351.1 hypothetical protein H310_02571 [Aphanomyces invadans]
MATVSARLVATSLLVTALITADPPAPSSAVVAEPAELPASIDGSTSVDDANDLNGVCRTFHTSGSWWRYEWCHEGHVRQYSVDATTGDEADVILLGTFDATHSSNLHNNRAPDNHRAYLSHVFLHGDMCASAQVARHRSTQVRFTCCVFRPQETYIESVAEPRLCDYLVTVCTPTACRTSPPPPSNMTLKTKEELAATVKRMFYHAYDSYMTHAFPLDNLKPISCKGENFELGKIPMLTLIDTLDTLVVFGDKDEFRRAVALVTSHATFDLDAEVSVFETTIRVLGGLLSAHLFAIDPALDVYSNASYSGGLLDLAVDLADRLLPAFLTKTGIPYGTVNLRRGVPKGETTIASTAGAGSLSIEFTMLSVLTKNPIYAKAARHAVRGLFFRRSALGLVGKHIDTKTGEWTESTSGPGSNSDSFYEYLLKMYVLFGDMEAYNMFQPVYSSVMEHNKHGDWYTDVSMWDGCVNAAYGAFVFENLVAFWPGMQSLLGDFTSSTRSLNAFYQVWQKYSFLPEQFDVGRWRPKKPTLNGYPLRPELLESTFYVHVATNDPSWLTAGALAVQSLERYAKTTCGYASIADVESRAQDDTMPSFFLSETCKYLYLLFDDTNFLRTANYVFTTEAHPFPVLPPALVDPILRASDEQTYVIPHTMPATPPTCPVLEFWRDFGFHRGFFDDAFEKTRPRCQPPSTKNKSTAPSATRGKDDGMATTSSLYGGKLLGSFQVEQLVSGFRVTRTSHPNEWIKVTNLGDPQIVVESEQHAAMTSSPPLTEFRVYDFATHAMRRCRLVLARGATISCSAAQFGLTRDAAVTVSIQNAPLKYGSPEQGCSALQSTPHRVVVVHRGECYFEEKARHAMHAGAAAAVVVNALDKGGGLMIMGPSKDSTTQTDMDIPVVMVPFGADAMLREAEANHEPISLEVGIVTDAQHLRVSGSRFDMAIAGADGWGIKLVAKRKPRDDNNDALVWTISITDAAAGGTVESARHDADPASLTHDDVDEYHMKLKLLGFTDDQLAHMGSDDPEARLDALVKGLRALGLEDVATVLLDESSSTKEIDHITALSTGVPATTDPTTPSTAMSDRPDEAAGDLFASPKLDLAPEVLGPAPSTRDDPLELPYDPRNPDTPAELPDGSPTTPSFERVAPLPVAVDRDERADKTCAAKRDSSYCNLT